MDQFDFKDGSAKSGFSINKLSRIIWSLGAAYFLCMTVILVGYFALNFINPNNPYNIFPPIPTQTPVIPTNTAIPAPATTPAPATEEPTATEEPEVTDEDLTLTDGEGEEDLGDDEFDFDIPTEEAEPTEQVVLSTTAWFEILDGDPTYLAHPAGCEGMYIAGNVTDLDDEPLIFMMVRIQGILAGETIGIEDVFSGTAPEYSESGWELQLTDAPVASSGTLYIQLFDPETEEAVSDLEVFNTYEDCNRNLIMIDFEQVK